MSINARRGSPLWMFGRLGILIVFGIIPLWSIQHSIKYRAFRERFDYCRSNCNYAIDVQNFDATDMWLKQADIEAVKFYGASYTNR